MPEEEAFDREHISADLFGQSAGQLVGEERGALPEGCYLVRGFLPAAGEDSEIEDEIAVLEKVTAGDKIRSVRGVGADERGFALSESGASPAGCYVKLAVQDVDEFGFLVAVDVDRAMRLLLSIITYNFGNVNRKLSFDHRKLKIGT